MPESVKLEEWAARQLADFDARDPGSLFGEGLTLDVAGGYELQTAVTRLREARGERVIGYKVGCTSPTIRTQLGIEHSVCGRLYDTERHESGAELSRERFANLAIEGELAVELSREPSDSDFAEPGIPACVSRVFPVIELHHHVMRGAKPSAGELIAHNAIHAGFVAASGGESASINGELSLAIYQDNELLERCRGNTLVQTIHSSLNWLRGMLRQRGERLVAGQIVLTGSIPPLIPISRDCSIRVETSSFGCTEARFYSR